jgi:hypothetical protein
MASEGQLSRFLDLKTVEKTLLNMYYTEGRRYKVPTSVIPRAFRKGKGEQDDK